MRIIGNNENVEEIDLSTISIFTLNKYLKNAQNVFLIVRRYYVGEQQREMGILGGLTLGKESKVREKDGQFLADLMFSRMEYPMYEESGEVLNYNGMEMVKVAVTIKKEDILKALAVPK